MGRPTGAAREGRCEWGRGRGRACLGEGACRACFQSGPLSVGGGGGRGSKRSALLFPGPQGEPAHGLHPRFVVAEIWADRGFEGGGGGGVGVGGGGGGGQKMTPPFFWVENHESFGFFRF